jgi:hypothetical protein
MSLDISQYERVYAKKKEFAIEIAEGLIESFVKSGMPCCKCCSLNIKKSDITGMSKEHLETILLIVDAIMFSSGFWASHTIRKHPNDSLSVNHKISQMSAEEKAEQLSHLDSDDEESDPEPVFTDAELARK